MGQALYRKYRSKSLSEIVGQEHIITTLQNALKKGAISHAYLFTGPRGVGKTSIARILAHEINGLDYGSDTPHIDIIEIDAASNRRIDEIRDLRDKVHIAPTSSKYKVYIIDEVHMLTKEAFNALLKTLEEPPTHVIFILATTESHKLPETIVSRTQRFTFKSIEPIKAVKHLREIADKEKLKISDEALALIAEHGDGSFRDSIGLLDQVSSQTSKIEAEDVQNMLGIAPTTIINDLYQATLAGTPKNVLDSLKTVQERGYEPALIAKQLAKAVREQVLDGSPASSDPFAKLEVVLLGINLENPQPNAIKPKIVEAKVGSPKPVVTKPPEEPPQPVELTDDFSQAWSNVLAAVKQQYNTLYGVLRMAQPALEDQKVTLGFEFPFHQKKLTESKNREIVAELLIAQLGHPVSIATVVNKAAKPAKIAPAVPVPPSPAVLDTISNIFGTAEVLES